ncbi:hypothetical protein G6N82_04980 [Altererythrobacter sp. BO-6]|uniref:hypothetical protein n=1 Tax=Altererythrobacter sp. BO-6 TaxID=2604537 RepID=UPI0013E142C4|nr:hypothetical protein [Altererythrobacter sp. BO-6]QIG53589.1 hypothetical protein G6N82_04980 [Altererythrobacter sp. BO-6]
MSKPDQPGAISLLNDPDRKKPQFLDNPGQDKAVAAILRLAMEISVLRDRIDTHEALAEQSGAYTALDVESYNPDPERAARRAARRKSLIEGLMHDLS